MKILLISEYYWPHIGGVEVLFQNLAERLAETGHEVTVLTARVNGAAGFEMRNGVKIYRVWVPRFADRYFFSFLAMGKAVKLARETDLIHATMYNAVLPAWIAARVRGRKSVLTVHEVYGERWGRMFEMNKFSAFLHKIFEKLLLSFRFDRYVTVSDATRSDLAIIRPELRIERIHNGIDRQWKNDVEPVQGSKQAAFRAGRATPLSGGHALFSAGQATPLSGGKAKNNISARKELGLGEGFVYMFYGRAGLSKGLEYLVRAVPEISRRIPGSKLFMILSKKPAAGYAKIIRIINQLGLEDEIIVHEPVPYSKLPEMISVADCVVIPSLSEGFGFTAAESCAMGKPVVVSRTASLPEVVSGEVAFVEPANSSAIADGVLRIYQGRAEKLPGKDFDWEKTVSAYERVYQELA